LQRDIQAGDLVPNSPSQAADFFIMGAARIASRLSVSKVSVIVACQQIAVTIAGKRLSTRIAIGRPSQVAPSVLLGHASLIPPTESVMRHYKVIYICFTKWNFFVPINSGYVSRIDYNSLKKFYRPSSAHLPPKNPFPFQVQL
jgi:hypothetical protein